MHKFAARWISSAFWRVQNRVDGWAWAVVDLIIFQRDGSGEKCKFEGFVVEIVGREWEQVRRGGSARVCVYKSVQPSCAPNERCTALRCI